MSRRFRPSASALATHALRALTGRRHALLTGRGAAGIWATLVALGFRDRPILLPANTCYIVLWAVLASHNRPVLVDIDPRTGNVSADTLDACPVAHPAAIIPCHMYGLSAPMKSIMEWARHRSVFVIEDAALAIGAQVEERPAGAWGDVAIFSFGQGKIVDLEVGGALLTDDDALAAEIERILENTPLWSDQLTQFTNQWHSLYWALHQHEADNPRLLELYPKLLDLYHDLTAYRMPAEHWRELPSALEILPQNLAHRARLSALYDTLIGTAPVLTLPRPPGSILWRYPLLVSADGRRDLLEHLWAYGVHNATRWYPPLRYMLSALAPDVPIPPTPFADQFGAQIINLPTDATTSKVYAAHTVEMIHAYFA